MDTVANATEHAREWRFARDGREWGPVSLVELREMVAAGELHPDVLVSRDGGTPVAYDELLPCPTTLVAAGEGAPRNTLAYFPVSQELRYAGFWERFLALLVDLAVLFLPATIFAGLLVWLSAGYATARGLELFVQLVVVMFAWVYYAGLESSPWQATVGKRLLGLKVTDESGEPISFNRACGRFFAKFLSATFLYLGFIMVAFSARKQGLHDVLSQCLVVRRR